MLSSENNIEKNVGGFAENPGDWFSFPGDREILWISRSLPANAGDLTCMKKELAKFHKNLII